MPWWGYFFFFLEFMGKVLILYWDKWYNKIGSGMVFVLMMLDYDILLFILRIMWGQTCLKNLQSVKVSTGVDSLCASVSYFYEYNVSSLIWRLIECGRCTIKFN